MKDSTVTATYNNAGRLQTLANSSSTEVSIYNALGQRIRISGGVNGTVLYAYDEAGHLLGEYDSTGGLIEETVWLGDIPVATLRPNGATVSIYYVHSDQLNTPREVTRPSDNTPMWTWNSDAFGTDAANPNPAGAGTFAYNLRFPGQLFDGQAGLHDNWLRDYDPAVARYAQSDPIGIDAGINTFTYVGNNPLTWLDPTGLVRILDIPGANGETSVNANPGPEATDYRAEHDPPHVHLGSNSGPRVSTKDFKPLSDDDAKKMTRKQLKFCESLSEQSKDLIRQRQQQIFKYGRITPTLKPNGFINPFVFQEMTPWDSSFGRSPAY